jgi:hypothetical protein
MMFVIFTIVCHFDIDTKQRHETLDPSLLNLSCNIEFMLEIFREYLFEIPIHEFLEEVRGVSWSEVILQRATSEPG